MTIASTEDQARHHNAWKTGAGDDDLDGRLLAQAATASAFRNLNVLDLDTLDRLAFWGELERIARKHVDEEIVGARDEDQASWPAIGDALGVGGRASAAARYVRVTRRQAVPA